MGYLVRGHSPLGDPVFVTERHAGPDVEVTHPTLMAATAFSTIRAPRARAERPSCACASAAPPSCPVAPALYSFSPRQTLSNRGKLGQGGLQVFNDLGGDDLGRRQVIGVFEGLISEPEDVERCFVARH